MFLLLLCSTHSIGQAIYALPAAGTHSHMSSFENINGCTGAGGVTNKTAKGNAFESLGAGQSKSLLEIHEPGIIQRIWCTIDDRSPAMLRALRLRMYWDGNAKPAVDVPFGDFFCAAVGGPVAFQSAFFSNPEGRSFICTIPMPFKKGAKITLTNESARDLNLLFYDVDFITMNTPPSDMMYFHAQWNRQKRNLLGSDFELLSKVNGTGRFIGVNVGINVDSAYEHTWWGEGEVKMYIDGDSLLPSINGTGAEDYTGTGWGLGKFNQNNQACTIADAATHQYAFYRFHIPDAIYFHRSIKCTIQEIGGGSEEEVRTLVKKGVNLTPVSVSAEKHFYRLMDHPQQLADSSFPKGWVNFFRIDDYSATAYFYLDAPVSNLPALVPAADRKP